jgi:2-hydroxychromene-2-carboxylate isomerase
MSIAFLRSTPANARSDGPKQRLPHHSFATCAFFALTQPRALPTHAPQENGIRPQEGKSVAQQIDYYFTCISPFSYLGHQAITDVAAKHGAALNIKPINLAGLWESSGAVPLPQRSAMRQRYRLIELQRCAEYRGLPITPKPAHFPVNPTLADQSVIAIIESGGNPQSYLASVFRAIWVNDRNISDETVLADLLGAAGHDTTAVLEKAQSDEIAAIRARNTEESVAADAMGAPAYVVNGEPFWGQDRIEMIDRMLTTGRAPFAVPE